LPEAIKELEGLVAAIEARDADKATELCDVHVRHSEQNVMRQLSDESDATQDLALRDLA
jgi:DNA-binding GntR family transcriptional regulator